jgi:hypothetical protein
MKHGIESQSVLSWQSDNLLTRDLRTRGVGGIPAGKGKHLQAWLWIPGPSGFFGGILGTFARQSLSDRNQAENAKSRPSAAIYQCDNRP